MKENLVKPHIRLHVAILPDGELTWAFKMKLPSGTVVSAPHIARPLGHALFQIRRLSP